MREYNSVFGKLRNIINKKKEESSESQAIEETLKSLPIEKSKLQTLAANVNSPTLNLEKKIKILLNDESIYTALKKEINTPSLDLDSQADILTMAMFHHPTQIKSLLEREKYRTPDKSFLVRQFFNEEPIKKETFIDICSKLNLDWREILDVDFLKVCVKVVPKVRFRRRGKIQDQCGTLTMLYLNKPIELGNLYVNVNILEKPMSYRWLEFSKMPQGYDSKQEEPKRLYNFGLGRGIEEKMPGLEAVEKYSKLMILGQPGSGKTTYLQYIATQCNQDNKFQDDRVPIFIRLKNFAEDAKETKDSSLLNYIFQEFSNCGASEESEIEDILKYGKALILLDGLDEVPEESGKQVSIQIDRLAGQYYKNKLLVTCRLAAQRSTFTGFTYVEVSPFDQHQIEDFAKKFFVAVARQSQKNWCSQAIKFFDIVKNRALAKAGTFIKELNLPENQGIRELAVTPILLLLACLLFEEQDKFPSNRADLYKEGLEILLRKWDEHKGIERGEIYRNLSLKYRNLSLKHKQELLSQLAKITFENNRYFFNQKEIEQYIADYLRTLPDAQNHVLEEECSSETVLKSIELQHGLLVERAQQIYSFSHLTFQEYFTARAFVESSKPQDLENLASHILEQKWREVFLLAAGIVPKAKAVELLLSMKKKVDGILNCDKKLQELLAWSNQKSQSVETPYKLVAVRAFYQFFALNFKSVNDSSDQYLNFARNFDSNFLITSPSDLSSDLALARALLHIQKIYKTLNLGNLNIIGWNPPSQAYIDLASELEDHHHPIPRRPFLHCVLRDRLPRVGGTEGTWRKWWKDKGWNWTRRLREVVIKDYNIIYDWQLTLQQERLLEKYFTANKLLMDCLNIASERFYFKKLQEIEDTLLLPITEIEKKHQPDGETNVEIEI